MIMVWKMAQHEKRCEVWFDVWLCMEGAYRSSVCHMDDMATVPRQQ